MISHSYSSDELSAITRLNYSSFSDLLEFGVKTGDMHPAGIQVFMKLWSNLFGMSEIAMRIPFVIAGTISIFLIYKIGVRFSNKIGLLSASIWAFLLFPIIQSELARPYSPGLLFILLTAVFIFKILFDPLTKKQLWYSCFYLALSIAAAMYTHYFAFVTAAFMAITALVYIKKERLIPYLSAGILALLLFTPHIGITIYQTSIEGGIQWLAPPGKFWLFKFLFHAFNNSWVLIICFSIPLLLATVKYLSQKAFKLSQKAILLFVWFFGVYLTGVFLSYYFTPVLKFPVMLFALPFLVILISRYLKPVFNEFKGAIPILLITATLISTSVEKQLFKNTHYEVFKELAVYIQKWEHKIGSENITKVMNISSPDYLNFYAKKIGSPIKLNLDVLNYGDGPILDSILSQSSHNFLILGFSGRHTPVQFFNQALSYFPYIIDGGQYSNSSVYLLGKHKPKLEKKLEIIKTVSFKSKPENWRFEKENLIPSTNTYQADSTNIYVPQYIFPVSKKLVKNQYFLKVTLTAAISPTNQITIVAVPETRSGQPVYDNYGKPIWLGLDVEKSLEKSPKASFAFSLPPNMPSSGNVKTYIWNRNKKPFIIENVEIQVINNIWNN